MINYMIDPVLITGIPRGGTNIIAAAINACGAFGGDMTKQNKDYEEGEYSNNRIRDKIVKQYFDRNGWDSKGQFPIPDTKKVNLQIGWRKRIEEIMLQEGYSSGQWMYKDAKLSLIWPVWNDAFPDAKWIIVRRRTADIVQSCLKTGYMTAYDSMEDWIEWVHQYENKYVEMIESGLNCKIIWPERMINKDFKQMEEVIQWLGLEWNDEVINIIKPLLWGKKGALNGK
jgi:hypothetical protein